jgi:hypothetical protein
VNIQAVPQKLYGFQAKETPPENFNTPEPQMFGLYTAISVSLPRLRIVILVLRNPMRLNVQIPRVLSAAANVPVLERKDRVAWCAWVDLIGPSGEMNNRRLNVILNYSTVPINPIHERRPIEN